MRRGRGRTRSCAVGKRVFDRLAERRAELPGRCRLLEIKDSDREALRGCILGERPEDADRGTGWGIAKARPFLLVGADEDGRGGRTLDGEIGARGEPPRWVCAIVGGPIVPSRTSRFGSWDMGKKVKKSDLREAKIPIQSLRRVCGWQGAFAR